MAVFGTIEECQAPQRKRYTHQRAKEAPSVVISSVSPPSPNAYPSHTDMLDDLDQLKIEALEPGFEPHRCSGDPNYEPPQWRRHTPKVEDLQTTSINVENRREEIIILPTKEHFETVYNIPAEIEDYEARRRAVATVFYREKTRPGKETRELSLDGGETFFMLDKDTDTENVPPNLGPLLDVKSLDEYSFLPETFYTEDEDTENQLPNYGPLLDVRSLDEHSSLPEKSYSENFGLGREMITKENGCRFVVTNMHHTPEPSTEMNRQKPIHMPFGTFKPKMLKATLLKKLQRGIPLDRLTFTSDEKYPETSPCLQPSPLREEMDISDQNESDESTESEEYSTRTMTPEDWHYILTVCDDEDWDDFDRLWRDYVHTVTGDFLCRICDGALPRPGWLRVEDLRRGFE